MKTYFLLLCCILPAVSVHAEQICKPDSIPASTPDSQLIDNGDGTVTDSKTGLMWKKCLEGLSGNNCESGSVNSFTWQEALQQPSTVNNAGGFAGYANWRLPNIRELISLIEDQCYDPAINLNYFPNTTNHTCWSGSPYMGLSDSAWVVVFYNGNSYDNYRGFTNAVRLVRGGQ